jgi:hypothetical protein
MGRARRAVSALAAAVVVASAASATQARAASPARSSSDLAGQAAGTCADVYFLGARGSGEPGPGTPGWKATRQDPHGLGAPVNSAYQHFSSLIGRYRSIRAVSVDYPAASVSELASKHYQRYFDGLSAGVTWTLTTLAKQASACPYQQIVLAGYSQGAMVMHRVLHWLGRTTTGQAILARVTDAILIGDGDQVPHDRYIRYGSAALNARGIGQALPKLSHSSTVKFSPATGSRVLEVCNRHDIVCGWTNTNILACLDFGELCPIFVSQMVKIHESYPGSKPLLNAAGRAAADVRAIPQPDPQDVRLSAMAGQPFGHQLQADVASGRTLQWGLLPPEVMPPGLTLSPGGLISGTPTADGTSTTLIRVRSVRNGQYSRWVTAVISLTVAPASVWSQVPGPLPPNVSASLVSYSAAACADPGTCVVAGYYFVGQTETAGLLLTGSGTSWTAATAPLPANAWSGPGVSLDSAACGGPSACVVAGSYLDSADANQGLLLTGSGSSWTAAQAPLPAGATDAALTAVACPAANWCVAVGEYDDSSGGTHLLIETGFGATWHPETAAMPASVSGGPYDLVLACPNTTACVAAGDYTDAAGSDYGLIATMSGTTWKVTTAPLPAGAQPADYTQPIVALACPSASACFAVGYYRDDSGNTQGLVLANRGTGWTAEKAPVPANARANPSTELASISCSSATACAIAGSYLDQSSEQQGLLLTLSGTALSPAEAPLPPNAEKSGYAGIALLASVDCAAAGKCVAAGSYADTSGNWQGLLLTESGSRWYAAEGPLPQGTSYLVGYGPVALACLSATQCTAIGYYAQSASDPNNFVPLLVSGPA